MSLHYTVCCNTLIDGRVRDEKRVGGETGAVKEQDESMAAFFRRDSTRQFWRHGEVCFLSLADS